jgi:hypothetical protein
MKRAEYMELSLVVSLNAELEIISRLYRVTSARASSVMN